jgi:hypothetical protein
MLQKKLLFLLAGLFKTGSREKVGGKDCIMEVFVV